MPPTLDYASAFDLEFESLTSPAPTIFTDTSTLFGSSPQSPLFSEEQHFPFTLSENFIFPFPMPELTHTGEPAHLFPPAIPSTTPEPLDVESATPEHSHKSDEKPLRQFRKAGPGRPNKAQLAARSSPENRRSMISKSRQLHNDSASRSRARFTAVLEELWNEVPPSERLRSEQLEVFGQRQLSRAEKVEMAILYVRKLQQQLWK